MVIFGASDNLTKRKPLPAMYELRKRKDNNKAVSKTALLLSYQ